jgi:hypothetical protein
VTPFYWCGLVSDRLTMAGPTSLPIALDDSMKVLLAYYSRSGHTERLALRVRDELMARGHTVAIERVQALHEPVKWRLALPLCSSIPLLPMFMLSARIRRWWLACYPQSESAIRPLAYPDVSAFDAICIGMPKWLYLPYPIARYLNTVNGLKGKNLAAFVTFCGPPLKVFEIELLFTPLTHRLRAKGGTLCAQLAVSSHFHEFFFFHEMEYVFRLISRILFRRSLRSFTLGSTWAESELRRFCNELQVASEHQSARSIATP